MDFNERLLSLRKEKALSQEELGSELKVSRQTISKWELGETTPEMDKLILISDLFNISLDELVKGKGSREINLKETDASEIKHSEPKKGIYDIICLIVKIFSVVLLIDVLSMIMYFIFKGFPS